MSCLASQIWPSSKHLDLRLHARRLDPPRHVRAGGRRWRGRRRRRNSASRNRACRSPAAAPRHGRRARRRRPCRCPARPSRIGRIEEEVAAHAGGQVDDDVGAGRADAARPPRGRASSVARALAGLGIAHVADGRSRRRPLAASIAASAICAGVTGIAGCLPTVSPAPVTAQVTMTFEFNLPPLVGVGDFAAWRREAQGGLRSCDERDRIAGGLILQELFRAHQRTLT